MHSGLLAAETALEALERDDASERVLRRYVRRLDASYVTRNLRTFRHVPALLTNPRMYGLYPDALCRVAEDFFRADAAGHDKLGPLLWRHVVRRGGLRGALADAWRGLRALVR